MQVTMRLFALQRQQVGWRVRQVDVPDGATVGDAWRRLVVDFPVLEPSTGVVRFARNARYADASEQLADGDEVAVIPPVAGGSADAGWSERRFLSYADIRDVIQGWRVLDASRRAVPMLAERGAAHPIAADVMPVRRRTSAPRVVLDNVAWTRI